MVDVSGRMIGVQHEFFYIGWAEMKHARFVVIDPYDGMVVMVRHPKSPII